MAKDQAFRRHWDGVKRDHRSTEDTGAIEAVRVGTRIQVVAPYSVGFPGDARHIGGKWRHRSRCWSFPASTTEEKHAISELLLKYHEPDMVPDIFALPASRSKRAKEPKRDTCEGAFHVWPPSFTPGDTCQCGDVYLFRNAGGFEVRLKDI